MAKDTEYKRYDSPFHGEYKGARIATDPTCVPSKDGDPLVRFKVVADSRNERFEPLWVEVNVGKFNANAASWLQKGDVLHEIRGRIAQRLWGEDNDKVAISLEFADLVIPGALIATLKERGFDPQGEPNYTDDSGKKGKGKDAKKGAKPGKDAKKGAKPGKKPEVEIPDDEDGDGDVEIDEDGDGE